MLLLSFLLVPVVLGSVQERTSNGLEVYDDPLSSADSTEKLRTINNYVVKIDGNTLKSVQPTETSSRVLNLSGLDLQVLENNVFDNLGSVKNLDLGNNSISSIPNGLFSKLGNLEHLSLADNNITKFTKSFEGLDHLKTLNISNNPVTRFDGTDLFGLPKSSVVFTKGLSISTINGFVFEKKEGSLSKHFDYYYDDKEDEENEGDVDTDQKTTNEVQKKNVTSENQESRKKRNVEEYEEIKVCIDGDVLKMIAPLKRNETLPSGCQRSNLDGSRKFVHLQNVGIAKFEKGWYQLDETAPIIGTNFAGNKIVEVTEELMNDLPSSVRSIGLAFNKIERLNRGIMKNKNITIAFFTWNRISEIEAGAFENLPQLNSLYLEYNLLTDTKFAATLPQSVSKIMAPNNKITELTSNSFSRLHRLKILFLQDNLIQAVKSDSLRGLVNLKELYLGNNRITKLEPRSFQLPNLNALELANNSIASFGRDAFDRHSRMTVLVISHNKLSNITESFPDGLPSKLRILKLGFNEIEKLERGAFKNLPDLVVLSLSGNKISEIEPGSFDLPYLGEMSLDKNLLNEIDIDSFRGLKRLEELSLDDNGINSIPKGFMKNIPRLFKLDLSNNHIKRLQNGALYGFRRTYYSMVHLNNVPVEIIEGGLFDDM